MRLWVTRSQPGAGRTADALRNMGHDPVVQPVLSAETLDARLDLEAIVALAFTSGHAVEAFAQLSPRRDLPVFTTGDATAAQARQAGFLNVASAGGDAEGLARLIIAKPPGGSLLWPCAEEPARDLSALLAEGGVVAVRQPVYRTVMDGAAPPGNLDGVVIHSARAAQAVGQLLSDQDARSLRLYALSEQAAQPLAGHPFHRRIVATRPEESVLLALIAG
jgi:uroporphyrinogen-III synthase